MILALSPSTVTPRISAEKLLLFGLATLLEMLPSAHQYAAVYAETCHVQSSRLRISMDRIRTATVKKRYLNLLALENAIPETYPTEVNFLNRSPS
jgi:hypothetical protein